MKAVKQATRKLLRGSTLMICLPLVLGIFIIAVSLFSMTSTSSRVANRSLQKAQADALAEAGLNAIYCQMTNVPQGTTTINGSPISSTGLTGKVGSSSATDGNFNAKIVTQSSAMVNGQLTYTYVIEGDGTAPNGKATSKARSTFTMTQNGMGGFDLGNAAIKANGNVSIAGGSFTQDTTGQHGASVLSNGSISMNGAGAYVDGTASPYLASPGINSKVFNFSQLSAPMSFPDATTTANWRTSWLQQSQEATPTYPAGNVVMGDVTYKNNSTLTAPEYINGNLSVNSKATLTINPDPKAATPCVLFVHGTISVNGNALVANNGVLVVSDGTQTYNGNANVYSTVNMVNCGLISFSSDPAQAIKITGSAGVAKVGIVYAINGGVTLAGGSVFQGSIISGGSVASGASVGVSGGSSVRYQNGWDSQFSALATSYTSSGLSHWTRIQ